MNFGRATAHFVFSFQNYSSTSVPNICNNSRFRLRQEAMFFRVIVFSTKCNSFEFQNVFCKCFTDLLFWKHFCVLSFGFPSKITYKVEKAIGFLFLQFKSTRSLRQLAALKGALTGVLPFKTIGPRHLWTSLNHSIKKQKGNLPLNGGECKNCSEWVWLLWFPSNKFCRTWLLGF